MNQKFVTQLQSRLLPILEKHPDGIKEWDLLKALEGEGALVLETGDTLKAYQIHFVLFHCLYLLRDQVRAEQQQDMEIHCLNIQLLPQDIDASVGKGLSAEDKLRAFYLDWNNLEQVDADDVERMLSAFWKHYYFAPEVQDAILLFDIEADASEATVKQRYKSLVMQHHPDRGGDEEAMQRLNRAYEVLKSRF